MEFGHVGRKIAGLEKQLKRLELLPGTKEIDDEIMEVRKALNVWLDAESTMWQQRSRNLWLLVEIEILVFSMLKHPTDFKGTPFVGYVMKQVLGRRMTEV